LEKEVNSAEGGYAYGGKETYLYSLSLAKQGIRNWLKCIQQIIKKV